MTSVAIVHPQISLHRSSCALNYCLVQPPPHTGLQHENRKVHGARELRTSISIYVVHLIVCSSSFLLFSSLVFILFFLFYFILFYSVLFYSIVLLPENLRAHLQLSM
jgi:hypothetical protein